MAVKTYTDDKARQISDHVKIINIEVDYSTG